MTQFASSSKDCFKRSLSLKVKNTMKTNYNFKRNYTASSKCTVNHNCLLVLKGRQNIDGLFFF